MNHPKFAWCRINRDQLPDISVGVNVPKYANFDNDPSLSLSFESAGSVGFTWESNSLDYQPPAVFVLHDKNLAETLSWLRVYSRDSFPLSQFGRVLTAQEWSSLTESELTGRSFRDDRWASVVLGELLAQSDQEASLESLSVSRAQACFSMTVARTEKIHDSYSATRSCTERLRAIESDPRFLRRSIAVDSLVPIWSMASASFGQVSSAGELAEFIVSAAASFDARGRQQAQAGLDQSLPPGIFSDSIEERVVEFQKISQNAINQAGLVGLVSNHSAALVAASAFLVGRGTSHAFLLRKNARIAPLAQVWFGLLAGIAGSDYWDPLWKRALKGIEKHLRASFDWYSPPLSDISWAEYSWVVSAVRGHSAFSGMPRQVQASISIEVFPGAICQMRLLLEEAKTPVKVETSAQYEKETFPDKRSSVELMAALEQVIAATNRAKSLLEARTPIDSKISEQKSPDLFKTGEIEKTKKVSKRIRIKKA